MVAEKAAYKWNIRKVGIMIMLSGSKVAKCYIFAFGAQFLSDLDFKNHPPAVVHVSVWVLPGGCIGLG